MWCWWRGLSEWLTMWRSVTCIAWSATALSLYNARITDTQIIIYNINTDNISFIFTTQGWKYFQRILLKINVALVGLRNIVYTLAGLVCLIVSPHEKVMAELVCVLCNCNVQSPDNWLISVSFLVFPPLQIFRQIIKVTGIIATLNLTFIWKLMGSLPLFVHSTSSCRFPFRKKHTKKSAGIDGINLNFII